jgi:hypothetical protein
VRIYLDTSVYNRPFDDQTQPRIWLETLAFAVILQMIDALHLACAEAAESEYFLTCDDRVVRRYQGEKLRVLNPVDFVVSVMGGERWL